MKYLALTIFLVILFWAGFSIFLAKPFDTIKLTRLLNSKCMDLKKEEILVAFKAGNKKLDGNNNGKPCEQYINK